MKPTRRKSNKGRFSRELQKLLVDRGMDPAALQRAMAKVGYRLSKQFIGMMIAGTRTAPPLQIARIAEALKLDQVERSLLHRTGARDAGYEIDSSE